MRKLIIILPILALFIYFIPNLSSLGWVKGHIEKQIEQQIGGKLQIEKISLNWNGKQTCQNVKWEDQKNHISIEAKEIILTQRLIDCFIYSNHPIDLLVKEAKMACPNFLRILQKEKGKPLHIRFSPIKARISNGLVKYEKIDFDINQMMYLSSWGNINLYQQNMDIILGIHGKTLKKFFRKTYIPENLLLQVPISGKLNSSVFEEKILAHILKNLL